MIQYDIANKRTLLVGSSRDSILALHVTANYVREFDRDIPLQSFGQSNMEESKDLENGSSQKKFFVACIDESEYLSIFSAKTASNAGRGGFQRKIRESKGTPEEIASKDLFGMGYPYFISMYEDKVVCSSDYGLCLLEIHNNEDF